MGWWNDAWEQIAEHESLVIEYEPFELGSYSDQFRYWVPVRVPRWPAEMVIAFEDSI